MLATFLGGCVCLWALANVPLGSRSYIRSNIDESIARGVEYLHLSAHFRTTRYLHETNPLEIWMAKRVLAAHPHESLEDAVEDSWRSLRADRSWMWMRPLPGEPPSRLSDGEKAAISSAMEDAADRPGHTLWNVWFMYAIHPELGELPARYLSRFLGHDPRDWFGYNLTHRLFAYRLLIAGDSAASERWSAASRARLAALQMKLESMIDLLLSDLYLERVAFLLDAGDWSAAVPRWIERIIRDQQPDGGWAGARSLRCALPSIAGRRCSRGSSRPHPTLLATYALVLYRERVADAVGPPDEEPKLAGPGAGQAGCGGAGEEASAAEW